MGREGQRRGGGRRRRRRPDQVGQSLALVDRRTDDEQPVAGRVTGGQHFQRRLRFVGQGQRRARQRHLPLSGPLSCRRLVVSFSFCSIHSFIPYVGLVVFKWTMEVPRKRRPRVAG